MKINSKNIFVKNIGFYWIMVFLIPLVWMPIILNGVGVFDWDHVLQRYAAIYQSYHYYDQFPGNNIWAGGGLPLFQTYSGYGLFSILTLIFEPSVGIYLGLVLYYILGYFGSIRLASFFTNNESEQVFFALYVVFGSALAYHMTVGHIIFANILSLPYLLYLALNYRDRFSGIKSGLLFGIVNLDGFVYTNQYIALILILFIAWRLIVDIKSPYNIFYYALFLALGFLSVSAFKIISILPLWVDYPREVSGITNYSWYDWLRFSFWPRTELSNSNVGSVVCNGKWENANYLGLSALILLIHASFKKSILIIPVFLILIFSYSNDQNWYSFNYYLKEIPSFSSHLCTTRIRLLSPIVFGLAMLIIYKDEQIITIFRKKISKLAFMLFLVTEVFVVSFLTLLNSHSYNLDEEITVRSDEFKSYNKPPLSSNSLYSSTMSNIGIYSETESYISYSPNNEYLIHDVLSREHEFMQDDKEIKPIYWSPNKIIFHTNDLKNCISTKIRVSNLWSVNNEYIYHDKKVYEPWELICAFPDQNGRVVLNYRSTVSFWGLIINLTIISITSILILRVWRLKKIETI